MKLAQFDFQVNRVCEQTGMTTADAYKMVKQMGYDYIDCDFNSLDSISDTLKKSDLKIAQVYVFLDISSPDLEQYCAKMMDKVKASGTACLMPIPNCDTTDDLLQKSYETLQKITDEMKKAGIDTVLEDFNSKDKTFCQAAGLKAYLDNVPGLGCNFDTGNFFYDDIPLLILHDMFAPYIRHYHLKDRAASEAFSKYVITRERDGKQFGNAPATLGDLPIETIVRQAVANGYDGVFAIEHCTYNEQVSMQRSYDGIARILQG